MMLGTTNIKQFSSVQVHHVLHGHSEHDELVGVYIIQYRLWPIENFSWPIETCHTSFMVRRRKITLLAPTRIRYPDGPARSDSPYRLPQNCIQTKIFGRIFRFFLSSHFFFFWQRPCSVMTQCLLSLT